MWPEVTPVRQLNVYHIFDSLLGQLAGMCRITIQSWAVEPRNWVRSDPETSRESGNLCPQSSDRWGGIGDSPSTKDSAFANSDLNAKTSSPDHLASRAISSNSSGSTSSVLATLGVFLAYSSSCSSWDICCSIVEWSHCRGRNCCICRLVISCSRSIICWRWSHTIWTLPMGWDYWAIRTSTTCIWPKASYSSSVHITSLCVSTRAIMVPWSAGDMSAA